MWSAPNVIQALTAFIFDELRERIPVPDQFHEPIKKIIREILEDEHILFSSPSNANIGELSLKEQVALRQFLRTQLRVVQNEKLTTELICEAILAALGCIVEALPETEAGISLLQAPLIDLLNAKPGDIIDRVTSCFLSEDLREVVLLENIREALYTNACRASGIQPFEETSKAIIPASKSDLSPQELIRTYLADTPFRDIFQQKVPFLIRRERFNEHGAIFARSGHGKTQALRAFVAQFLQEPDPPALFLIDSLGALIDGIDRLEVFNTTLRDRLVILDPSRREHMPRLNFFNVQSDDLCFYLFKAIDQSFTPRQATMISYLMEYMRHVPQPDIFKLVEVCEAKTNKYPDILPQLTPFAKSFFENQFFAGKGGDPFVAQTKAQIAQRLYTLGRLPRFNEIFSAIHDVFDPYQHMQRKSVVLINTDARPPKAGGLGEGSAIFGRYILAQCLEAARARPKHERHLALLVVDEAKAYMDDQAALILSDARQFGMGMLLASQQPHQLPEGVRREINTNTSIRMMGNIEYSIAAQYARDMFCEPEFILKTKKYDGSHAEWATFVSGMDHAVKVNIPYGAIERMPKRAGPLLLRPKHILPKPQEPELDTYYDPDENPFAPYEDGYYSEEPDPTPTPPKKPPPPRAPASQKQRQNDFSLRDTEPLPSSKDGKPTKPKKSESPQREILEEQSKDSAPSEPLIKPGKDWD
jgi:hypothetical protein